MDLTAFERWLASRGVSPARARRLMATAKLFIVYSAGRKFDETVVREVLYREHLGGRSQPELEFLRGVADLLLEFGQLPPNLSRPQRSPTPIPQRPPPAPLAAAPYRTARAQTRPNAAVPPPPPVADPFSELRAALDRIDEQNPESVTLALDDKAVRTGPRRR